MIKENLMKIGDFGVAKISKDTETISRIGSFPYWPPEIFNEEGYDIKSDVW